VVWVNEKVVFFVVRLGARRVKCVFENKMLELKIKVEFLKIKSWN
jgi:hypothetical protein